jgi:hypothetical protein
MDRSFSLVPSFLASRQTLICLPIALAVFAIPPETGLGVDLCMLNRITGAPCPGCGVTRSCANLVRGHVRRSVEFHPLGVIFAPVLFGIAVLSLLPGAVRKAFAVRLSRCERALYAMAILFGIAFFVYGTYRWIAVMAGYLAFPPPGGPAG